ncbi:MAG: biotin transporter BioY [Lachnospiraceae bacterium]|nr:biotin transporter BioY [Lachnospiraceae bacterium]
MKKKWTTFDLTKMALLSALLSISSYITIPLPLSSIGLTAQTFVINLIALILTPTQAISTVLVWIFIGTCGLPVFSGGRGGFFVLAGPTGGYMFGFLLAVYLISLLKGRSICLKRYCLVTIGIGIPCIYLPGALFMYLQTSMNLKALVITAILPYIPMDIVKCIGASAISIPLQRALVKINTKK